MVVIRNHLGEIKMSKQFFSQLIGNTLVSCFGVVDTNTAGVLQSMTNSLRCIGKKDKMFEGVSVRSNNNKLIIDVHITVLYGVNVSSVINSIQHKIAFAVEDETGLEVEKVNVFVDGINS